MQHLELYLTKPLEDAFIQYSDIRFPDLLSTTEKTVTLEELKILQTKLLEARNNNNNKTKVPFLKDLIKGSKLKIPIKFQKDRRLPLDTEEISPELISRRAYLLGQDENRRYYNMVSNIVPKMGNEMTPFHPELTGAGGPSIRTSAVGINMIIAAGACFFAADRICVQFETSRTTRLFISIFVFVLILIVEMLLFIIRALKVEEMDKKRKQLSHQGLFPIARNKKE